MNYLKYVIASFLFIIPFLIINNVNAQDTYTVIFDVYNGKQIITKTVTSGNMVEKPEDPTREGYTFSGWYTDNNYTKLFDFTSPVTNNIKVYAKWSIKKFTVRFNTMGANTINSQIVDFKSKAKEPNAPTKHGYYFGGWYKDEEFEERFSFLTEIKENKELYALWLTSPKTTHDVTYVPGLGVDPFIVEIENEGVLDSPAIDMASNIETDHPIFGTWYKDPNKTIPFDFDTPITSDLILYGKWTLEDGTELMEAPDTASSTKIIYYVAGAFLLITSGFVVYSILRKNKKNNNIDKVKPF